MGVPLITDNLIGFNPQAAAQKTLATYKPPEITQTDLWKTIQTGVKAGLGIGLGTTSVMGVKPNDAMSAGVEVKKVAEEAINTVGDGIKIAAIAVAGLLITALLLRR